MAKIKLMLYGRELDECLNLFTDLHQQIFIYLYSGVTLFKNISLLS